MAPPIQRKLNPFRPFGNIATDATDYNIILNLGDDDWSLQSEDEDFSYYSGPLSDDAVVAVDYIQGWIDDEQSSDELDYDFTFALLEDAQVYAAQFSDDESLDETDYDFTLSPLSDDFIAAIDQIGQSFDDGEEEQLEYDFFASPLSADFVIAVDVPYASFDEYDEAFEGEEYSFYLGVVGDDTPIVPVYEQDWSGHDGKPRKQQHEYAADYNLKRKREIEAALSKAVKKFEPEVLDDAELLQVLDNAPKRTLQSVSNMVTEYRKLLRGYDEAQTLSAKAFADDEELAIVMMMMQ